MPTHRQAISRAPSLEESAVWQGWQAIVGCPERGIERRLGASVSSTYFDVLATRPSVGRLFPSEDGVPGHAPVVVLSHRAWRELFDGRSDAVGEELVLEGEPYTVIGVAPAGFVDPVAAHVLGASQEVDFWRSEPPPFSDAMDRGGWIAFWSLARVRPGVSPAHLRAEVVTRIRETYAS